MDPLSKNSENNSKDGDIKALMDGSGESTENIVRPGECTSEGLEDSSDLEGDMPFEPYDVNCDGRIMKTASQYSRDAWKHPEPEWEVAVTVHGFCEIATISTADDTSKGEDVSSSKETRMNKVEPNLQLEFKLGKDEHESFPQGVIDQAKAAGVELNPLLHSAIASMVRNERASFSVSRISADEARVDGETKPTTTTTFRLEYDISLDAWTEEIDLSDHDDGSLVKRVMRDGDGAVEPTEVGKVTVRCRITRKCFQSQGLGEETVVFDNLRSQDCSSEEDDALEGPLTFVLDDCPFGSGFTVIIKSMRTGELCEARLEPEYAPAEYLGDESFQHHAVVELLEVEDLPPMWSTDDVRLEMAKRFKLEGNEKFTAGDFIRALRRYVKAIQYADGVPPGNYSDEDDGFDDSPSSENERGCREDEVGTDERSPLGGREVEFVDLQVAILCNQAACHLKLGDGAAALEVADRASTFKTPVDDAAGVKAAYRRACALEAVGDLDEARVAFKSVLDVNPKNSQCIQGLARIARAEKAYQARLRKAFGGCLTSGKLKGFASEGREMSSETRQGEGEDGEDSFDARQRHLADGSWSDDSSSSETEENDDSYDEDLPLLAKGNKGSADVDQSPSVVEDSVSKAAERVQVYETACTGSGGSLSLSLNPAGDSPTGEQEMDEKPPNRSCSRSPQTGELSNSNENIGAKLVTEVLPPPPPQA